jgi:3-oxoacyl-(acyl-carrier-protein) synthase
LPIVIDHISCTTPLGDTLDLTLRAIEQGERVVDEGRVKSLNDQSPRVWQLARCVIQQTNEVEVDFTLLATSKGDADVWMTQGRPPTLAPSLAPSSIDLGGASPVLTFSAACASGLVALAHAMWMLRAGHASRIRVVACESSFHPMFKGCFKRLGVLAEKGSPCEPFHPDGKGFVISESAACVVLGNRKPRAGDIVLQDATLLADAFHLTSHRADGSTFARAIENLSKNGIADRVHAHATGTQADAVELSAIRQTLGDVEVWSHKRYLGHTLGASGLLATVLSCATMKQCEIVLAAGFGSPVAGVMLKREMRD